VKLQYLVLEDPDLKKNLTNSLIGHIAVFFLFTIKAVFFSGEAIIINNAVRVDLVSLPDKVMPKINEPAEVEPEKVALEKPVEKPIEKPKTPTFDLAKTKLEQKEALDKLKNQMKKKTEPAPQPEVPPPPQPTLYKGNVLSPGSEVVGVAKLEYDKYFDLARAKVKLHFILPQWLKDSGLRTHVLVKIDERGYVIDRSLVKSSGNEIYDKLVLKAIMEASPLPAPPDRLKQVLMIDGMVVAYPD